MSDQRSGGDGSTRMDAKPSFPRQSAQPNDQHDFSPAGSNISDQRSPTERLSIPEPPTDWQFNIFLDQLAEKMTNDDFSRIKHLFEGEGGIGKGVLEKMKTPVDLFRILKQRGYISRDNLLYLQSALFWTGRKDLVKEAVEHARTMGDVIHFYSPTFQPENGYRHIKFHVDGKDFQSYARQDLEKLRLTLSKLLFVPEKFVLIVGIEPASSIVITFMIPELYVEILRELLSCGENLSNLADAGVDFIDIDSENHYPIEGKQPSIQEVSEQQSRFANVYQQLRDSNSRLEIAETKLLELCHSFNEQEEKLKKAKVQIKSLSKLLSVTRDESSPASLKGLAALSDFTNTLLKINEGSTDRTTITKLIDTVINMVTARMSDIHRIQKEQLLLKLQDMQSQLIPLTFELERYKFCAKYPDLGSLDKVVLEGLQYFLNSLTVRVGPVQLTSHGLETTRKISSKLRYKEKEKLKKKYTWKKDGEIEMFMEADPSNFMAGLFHKEMERTQQVVDFESFILQCLSEIDREDLKKFLEPRQSQASSRFQQPKQHPQQQQNQQQHQFQQSYPQFNQGSRQEAAGSPSFSDQQLQDVIMKMAGQMQEMYGLIISRKSAFEDWKTPSFSFGTQAFKPAEKI